MDTHRWGCCAIDVALTRPRLRRASTAHVSLSSSQHPRILHLLCRRACRCRWKATAIGNNSAAAIAALKSEYPSGEKDKKEEKGAGAGAGAAAAEAAVPAVDAPFGLAEAQKLAVRVLCKALDTAHPSSERVEVALLTHETIIAALAAGAAAGGAGSSSAAGAAAAPIPAAPLASSATGAIAPGGAARVYAGRGKLVQAFMTPAQVDSLITEAVPPVPEAEAPGGVKASI